MYKYSKKSQANLDSCHKDLQIIFAEVLKYIDHSVLNGHRDEAAQEKYFKEGLTKLRYPHSKHNQIPSLAVDVAPYPVDWDAINRFYFFGGYVCGVAERLKRDGAISHILRWGGDWDCDRIFKDQTFNDLVHFELV
jgi:peptidoglycan L-alanyl-D-glutamate endopeptidase CwlK